MLIHFLGNGGFIGNGLPYNSFLIDGDFLIECPPDIMTTMHNQGVHLSRIKRIYLSHFHGDHYFGMPFFTLNLFAHCPEEKDASEKIDVIGPRGVRGHVIRMQKTAVSPDNPSVSRIDRKYNFIEIDQTSHLKVNAHAEMIFHRMFHPKETYGFSIIRDNRYDVTYLPDTVWDDSFSGILENRPRYCICDLNSDDADRIPVHMAEKDIVDRAIPVTGDATTYVGTHLRDNRVSTKKNIVYARPGTRIEITGA
jgi:phosphoribosyl 1,2-cyclic phosphodiesterase